MANQYKVQCYGTVVFDYKGRTERVTSAPTNSSSRTR